MRFRAICAALLLTAASAGAQESSVSGAEVPALDLAGETRARAQPGDVLFKSGSGFWGGLAAGAGGGEERFTHVGMVVHAGGEGPRQNWRVRRDSFASYLARANEAYLFRPALDEDERARALAYVLSHAERKTPFDRAYSLRSDRALYCTELIWRALMAATGEDPVPEKSTRMGAVYVLLSDLARSPVLALAWTSAAPEPTLASATP
jgi:hypothetical protein